MTVEERGLYPLGVEGAIAFHAARLVPFATTVTAHPRYYTLHSLAALHEGLDSDDTAGELTRRLDVLMAAASMLHARADRDNHDPAGVLSEPHGFRTVGRELEGTDLPLATLAASYSGNRYGYSGAYFGVEQALGLSGGTAAAMPLPDSALDVLRPLLALASHDNVPLDTLRDPALCLCATRTSSDGAALRTALFAADDQGAPESIRTARKTGQLSAALCITALRGKAVSTSVTMALADLCAYGDVAGKLPSGVDGVDLTAARWRGALLRNESVTAWRWMWAWVTRTLHDRPSTQQQLSHALAAAFIESAGGDLSYREAVLDPLPPGVAADQTLLPVEQQIRATQGLVYSNDPLLWLRMLAVGCRRLDELDEYALPHFMEGPDTWNPQETLSILEVYQGLRLSQIAEDLAPRVVRRAQQIARRRQQWTRMGLRMPTKLRPVGDVLYVSGPDGTGEAALRQFRLQQMLNALGILGVDDGNWTDGAHAYQILT